MGRKARFNIGDWITDTTDNFGGVIIDILPKESPTLPLAYRVKWYGYGGLYRNPTGMTDVQVTKGDRDWVLNTTAAKAPHEE